MRTKVLAIAAITALAALFSAGAAGATTYTWTSTSQYVTYTQAPYVWTNDGWGPYPPAANHVRQFARRLGRNQRPDLGAL